MWLAKFCSLQGPQYKRKNYMKCLARCAMISLLLFYPALHEATAQKAVPDLWGVRVHDEAGVLNQQTVQMLEHQLEIYEDSTSNQIAILIVASLENQQLEEYTLRVAETWKVGQKGK